VVRHGALSKSHVDEMLCSADPRVRRAAFTLLEGCNPKLKKHGALYFEVLRFIWSATANYDTCREFMRRNWPNAGHEGGAGGAGRTARG
jgi:hypothetical protein